MSNVYCTFAVVIVFEIWLEFFTFVKLQLLCFHKNNKNSTGRDYIDVTNPCKNIIFLSTFTSKIFFEVQILLDSFATLLSFYEGHFFWNPTDTFSPNILLGLKNATKMLFVCSQGLVRDLWKSTNWPFLHFLSFSCFSRSRLPSF